GSDGGAASRNKLIPIDMKHLIQPLVALKLGKSVKLLADQPLAILDQDDDELDRKLFANKTAGAPSTATSGGAAQMESGKELQDSDGKPAAKTSDAVQLQSQPATVSTSTGSHQEQESNKTIEDLLKSKYEDEFACRKNVTLKEYESELDQE
ncbi:unnamed protein product, partial [Amoebophrya sp. A120]